MYTLCVKLFVLEPRFNNNQIYLYDYECREECSGFTSMCFFIKIHIFLKKSGWEGGVFLLGAQNS